MLLKIIMKLVYPTVFPLFLLNLIKAQDVAETNEPSSCYYQPKFGNEDWGSGLVGSDSNCLDFNEYCDLDLDSSHPRQGFCTACGIRNDFWNETPDGDQLREKYVTQKLSRNGISEVPAETHDQPICPLSIKTFQGYIECCSKCLYSLCDVRAWHTANNIDPFEGKSKCEKQELEADFNNIEINYGNWLKYPHEMQLQILNAFTLPPLCEWDESCQCMRFRELQINQRGSNTDPDGVDGEPYCADIETGEKVSDIYIDAVLENERCMNDGGYEENLETEEFYLEHNGASSLAWSLTVGVVMGINWMV